MKDFLHHTHFAYSYQIDQSLMDFPHHTDLYIHIRMTSN